MRINILLPFYAKFPVGGFKVQYEYANGLAKRGHAVTILHPCRVAEPRGVKSRLARAAKWTVDRLTDQNRISWHALHEDVRLLSVPDLSEKYVPDADVTVATAWATAEMAKTYSSRVGKLFQIVYDYELWMTAEPSLRRRMEAAFRAGFGSIATSPAVAGMLAEIGVQPVAYIPCGLDFEAFGVDVPVDRRVLGSIGFPAREQGSKGTTDAVSALQTLRARRGDKLRVSTFGPRSVAGMPDWVDASWFPTDNELRSFYNSISIFIFPSHFEGWGLPGMEALACGAALVAADSVGLREYAHDGQTALIVPRARPDLLATAVEKLLDDDQLRQRLARQGNAHVQQYTWTRATDALEALFKGERSVPNKG